MRSDRATGLTTESTEDTETIFNHKKGPPGASSEWEGGKT